MWDKDYRDYPRDQPLKKQSIESGKGLPGCEMHEINGWGNTLHYPVKKKKRGFLTSLFIHLFHSKKENDS
jgi:hypothetical protein